MNLSDLISARVWKLGDNVNTDLLHPPSYFSLDREIMKNGLRHGMERLGSRPMEILDTGGLVIVAGENFGCGSSRETSVRALASSGVKCVVAVSLARIFSRSLVNLGIPPLSCRGVQEKVKDGDSLVINVAQGYLEAGQGGRFRIEPMDEHHKRILECGGLIPYLEQEKNGI